MAVFLGAAVLSYTPYLLCIFLCAESHTTLLCYNVLVCTAFLHIMADMPVKGSPPVLYCQRSVIFIFSHSSSFRICSVQLLEWPGRDDITPAYMCTGIAAQSGWHKYTLSCICMAQCTLLLTGRTKHLWQERPIGCLLSYKPCLSTLFKKCV